MIKKYCFFDSGTLEFDDSRSVRELIEYAFEEFDYYEPMGMDAVTVFQGHHPETTTGWFTVNTELSCAEEIANPDDLFFAYHIPDLFYFAEGGWGHHMRGLGNRPAIPDEAYLKLKIDGPDNTVVINGNYTLEDVVKFLTETDYISDCSCVCVSLVGIGTSYRIPFTDPIMKVKLKDFHSMLEKYNEERFGQEQARQVCFEVLSFC